MAAGYCFQPPPFLKGGEQKPALFKKGEVAEGQKKGGWQKKGEVVQKMEGGNHTFSAIFRKHILFFAKIFACDGLRIAKKW